jgi:hypothetical protein
VNTAYRQRPRVSIVEGWHAWFPDEGSSTSRIASNQLEVSCRLRLRHHKPLWRHELPVLQLGTRERYLRRKPRVETRTRLEKRHYMLCHVGRAVSRVAIVESQLPGQPQPQPYFLTNEHLSSPHLFIPEVQDHIVRPMPRLSFYHQPSIN